MHWSTSGLWDCPLDWDCHPKLVVGQYNSSLKKECGWLLTDDFGVSGAIDFFCKNLCRILLRIGIYS